MDSDHQSAGYDGYITAPDRTQVRRSALRGLLLAALALPVIWATIHFGPSGIVRGVSEGLSGYHDAVRAMSVPRDGIR